MIKESRKQIAADIVPDTPRARGSDRQSDWIVLAVLIAILLVTVASFVDWHRLSVDGLDGSLNDQVGYVSVARNLADHGTLESNLIYPLVLRQHVRRNSFYMPGFYWLLAAVYKCFGYSAAISRLPSLASFLLSCWLIYWIAARLYSGRAAAIACTLFAVIPLSLVYAFTAMMEMPLVAAGLGSFAIFLRARQTARFWVAPLALLLPFVFRETGAILAVLMLAALAAGTEKRSRHGVICALLMLLIVAAALYSPLGAGRPSLWKANILVDGNYEEVYGDAFATDHLPSQFRDWSNAIGNKASWNLHTLIRPEGESAGFFEQSVLWFIVSGIPLGLVGWFRKKDFFALGVSAAVLLLLTSILCLYSVWGYRGVRVLLILQPFVAILWGTVLARLASTAGTLLKTLPILLLFVFGAWGAFHILRSQAEVNQESKENTKFLESILQGDRQLLASPFWLSLDYANQHYPQKWSFVPSNCETMRLLDERYGIGTMLVPVPGSEEEPSSPPRDLACGTELKFAGQKEFHGSRFWLYRRRASGI